MPRPLAWLTLLGSLALIYSLAFTTYELETGSWETTESGGLSAVTIVCPSPFDVLVRGAEPDEARYEGACDRSSRTLVFEALFVAVAAGLLVWKPVTRPRPAPIEPLSERISLRETTPGD